MDVVRVPRRFDASALPSWLAEWTQHRSAAELTFDFPADCFLHPVGVALLASCIAERRAAGRKSAGRFGASDSAARRYLQRIDFFRELGIAAPEDFERRAADGRFAELRGIRDLRTAREQADRLRSCIEAQFPEMSPSVSRQAAFVLEELCANVVQHSNAPQTGFALAEAFPAMRSLELAVSDAGVGFLASLQRNPDLAGRVRDSSDALQLALHPRVSREGPGNLGIGLSELRNFVVRLGGTLEIVSGDAHLVLDVLHEQPVTRVKLVAPWQGAIVSVRVPVPDLRGAAEPRK